LGSALKIFLGSWPFNGDMGTLSSEPDDQSPEKKAMNRRRLRMFVAALATVALLLGVAAAAAQSRVWRRPPPPRPQFSVAVEDGGGNPLRTYSHRGTTWVLGEEGERYVVVVRNPSPERVEAVVSVDGRDVLSGRAADFRKHRGYIVPAYGSVRIEGFRQSLDSVATFRFTDPSNSYSSRMGTPQNVGVIGVAVFRENVREQAFVPDDDWGFDRRGRRHRPAPPKASRPSGAAPRAEARDSDSSIGTEYGESRSSRVMQTFFERATSTPARVLTLRYDDAEGLQARGIEVFGRHFRRVPPPRPFPQAFVNEQFAPPPP
jgi:hypothetical protein